MPCAPGGRWDPQTLRRHSEKSLKVGFGVVSQSSLVKQGSIKISASSLASVSLAVFTCDLSGVTAWEGQTESEELMRRAWPEAVPS